MNKVVYQLTTEDVSQFLTELGRSRPSSIGG